VGSTALSGRLDPEDLREVLRAYQAACSGAIERFDGRVAQYLGDGILAYFGYPTAHEDDARRAVGAALDVLGEIARLSARMERERGATLAVRVGVHTGVVVAGEMGAGNWREDLAVGDTPNVAARLQALAQANSIAISGATHRLVRGYFDCHHAGAHALRGVAQAVEVYRVVGATDAQERLEAAGVARLASLLGREAELAQLREFWTGVRGGAGRVVVVTGDGGIGKSRLLQALVEHADAGAPYTRLRYYCSEQHTSSSLYPVIRQLERAAGFAREDDATARLDKLEALLAPLSPSREALALLADLLSIGEGKRRYPLLDQTPQRRRQATFAELLRQIELLAMSAPVLLLFEDVHWTDPSSQELLRAMSERARHLSVLVVVTCRPDYDAAWLQGEHFARITLGRLEERDCRRLVERIAEGGGLPETTLREIVGRSDGVPLFAEELTKAMLEARKPASRSAAAPRAPAEGVAVPETLHSTLLARLDRLGSAAKEVAQIGAAIGRHFYFRLLAAVANKTEEELRLALRVLGEAALLVCRGTPPEATYVFKHALVQDAAYATLLRGRRRELHAAIAEELEHRHAGGAASQEMLAHHYTQADQHLKAVRAWRAAARQSVDRGSFAEARAQLQTGLALLESLPEEAERDRLEAGLQNALGNVLIAQRGYTANETREAFERARRLAARLDDPGQGLRALWGLGTALLYAGRLAAVLKMMDEAAPLVVKNGHLDSRLAFSVVHGSVLLDLGRIEDARRQLENTLAIDSEPARDRERAMLYGQSPRISALGCLSIVALLLDRPEQSRAYYEQGMREAENLVHKPMLCLAHSMACRRAWLAGARQALERHAALLQQLALDQGTPLWLALARSYGGWSLVEQDRLADGIAEMREGMLGYQSDGARADMSLLRLALAHALARAAREVEAQELFTEALSGDSAGEERWLQPELERGLGAVLARRGRLEEAEAAMRSAIAVARSQSSRLFELRAGGQLGRFLLSHSRKAEAREVLRPLCTGQDPPELRDLLRAAES
jgi:predicted ATPase/class 3 adenylate cyclase